MADLKKELLARLKKNPKKGRRNIYISDDTWEWLATWCKKQTPERAVSHIIEELIEMLRSQEGKKK